MNFATDDLSSISASMDWPQACEALANGNWPSSGFRRRKPVMQVVETLGLTDGRHFARIIIDQAPHLVREPRIASILGWGDPLKAPKYLTGWPDAVSPTSLRYLAHALWLKSSGLVPDGGNIVEVGVGFGGLAALNAIISSAITHPVDLAPVKASARKMMEECALGDYLCTTPPLDNAFTFISNYAFTELSSELQKIYLESWMFRSQAGMLVSNADHFHERTGNFSVEQITKLMGACGKIVTIYHEHVLLSPSDLACGNSLIVW